MSKPAKPKRKRRRKLQPMTAEQRVNAALAADRARDRAMRDAEIWEATIRECMCGEHYHAGLYKPLSLDQWEAEELQRRATGTVYLGTYRIARASGDQSRPRKSRREYWTFRMLPSSAYEAKNLMRYLPENRGKPEPDPS